MKFKNVLIAAVSTIAPLLTILPTLTLPVTAQSRSLCSANIGGRQPGTLVNMRSSPRIDPNNPEANISGSVLVDQRVTLLTNGQLPTNPIIRRDNQGMNWYLVEDISNDNIGWVRADYIVSPNCR